MTDETRHPDADELNETPDMTGQILSGRYQLLERVGEGAMGSVYRGIHTLMKKPVAIKLLHPALTTHKEIMQRFQREAQAAAHVEHPNVCGATDFGEADDGAFFLVMEFLEGGSLKDVLAEDGPLGVHRAVHVATQIASGLSRAHEMGVIHRDLKPDNVFLVERDGDSDFVKIVDFGIARVRLDEADEDIQLTQAGMVYGTPQYLSPEQAVGEEIDSRADLYALGILIFEMIAGRTPFLGTNIVQLIGKHVTQKPPLLSELVPGVDPRLEAIVTRLLAKTPADRYPSAESLVDALNALGLEKSSEGGSPDVSQVERADTLDPVPEAPDGSGQGEGAPTTGVSSFPKPGTMRIRKAPPERTTYPASRGLSEDGEGERLSPNALSDPTTTLGGSPLSVARERRINPALIIAAAVIVILGLAIVLVVALSGGEEAPTPEEAGQEPLATAKPTAPQGIPALNIEREPAVVAAVALLEAGEARAAIDKLEAARADLEGELAYDALYALALARAGDEPQATKRIEALLAQNPELIHNERVLEALMSAFSARRAKDATGAVEIIKLANDPVVATELALVAMVGPTKDVRKRAKDLLDELGALDTVEEWARVGVELRFIGGCKKRKPLVKKLADLGDPRALPVVTAFAEMRGSCGIIGGDDCWPCMRAELDEAVQVLEARRQQSETFGIGD